MKAVTLNFRRVNIEYSEGEDIKPSYLRYSSIETYAESVRKLTGFQIGDDLLKIAKWLGGRIHYQHLDEWLGEDGSIYIHNEFDFDILLPHYTSPMRDRFTICHELGHYYLHSRQGEIPTIAHRKGSSQIEWEANRFAAALLMPADEFVQACRNSTSLSRVAIEFGVSEQAANVRKESLGV